MEPGALRHEIQKDIHLGFKPWMIIASLGTTGTGSIDPIAELLKIKKEYELWLHIDAAYGGFFALTPWGKKIFEGFSESDSIVLDPHKSLFMPYGCGAVLVRESKYLKAAFSADSADLIDITSDLEKSPADYSLELTRHFRAPRIILSLKAFGTEVFKAALEEKLALAWLLYQELKDLPELEFACEPELSVVTFRMRGEDHRTQKLLSYILQQGKIHLSSTQLAQKIYLRACVLSFRTHLREVNECIHQIKNGVKAIEQ
jgi:glutamate/tyrosine decarboxylase-like PLP-dependent enzyme